MKPSYRRLICILTMAPIFSPAQVLTTPDAQRQPELAQQAPAKATPRPELSMAGAVSSNPLSFVAIAPCRMVDTRSTTVPAQPAGFGAPSLLPSFPRNFPLPQGACGLPTNPAPQAYSLNVTVVPIAGASLYGGFIVIYPGLAGPNPGPVPLFASLVWQGSTVYLSNAVIVASNSTDGSVYVDSNVKTDVVIDINGYFAAPTDSAAGANTALGYQSLQANTAGTGNTANGYQALESNSVGIANTASGSQSLQANTSGTANTASGFQALEANVSGQGNTAFGFQALSGNLMGVNNTAIGGNTLLAATGNYNVALGFNAGSNLGAGSNNILIGNPGTPEDGMGNAVIRIGYLQSRTFIDGIRGKTTGSADAVPVVIDSNGQLGTVNSSGRFKEDIQDMAGASSGLLRLRPVTYRYKQPYADGSKPIDYGLIAEEVAGVYPDLVVRGADGLIETIQYQKLTPMLVNELQKQSAQGRTQGQIIQLQQQEIEKMAARLAALEAAIAGGRVSAEPAAR
jgi:hypothetical protein